MLYLVSDKIKVKLEHSKRDLYYTNQVHNHPNTFTIQIGSISYVYI